MADPSFNLKTGADSQLYYAREVTQNGVDKDKIKSKDGTFSYPCLARQTGNSIKGTTESIESNELRKGRTKSAPRKGNSSAEGSLDFELSPLTYDDMFEAALRGKWVKWTGDLKSTNKALVDAIKVSNLGFTEDDYCIASRCANKIDNKKAVGFGRKKLFRFFGNGEVSGYNEQTKAWGIGTDVTNGLFEIPKGSIIHELNTGTTDIKYMLLRQFGGVEGEDLFQRFDHMAVSTISNDISVGQIITGSVGFMGANDPKMLNDIEIKKEFGAYDFKGTEVKSDALDVKVTDAVVGSLYFNTDEEKFFQCVEVGETTDTWVIVKANANQFVVGDDAQKYIERLPNAATQTDQFTAREGFLYLNGKNIEFANAMDWNLDNGLEKNFAIFVRNSISTTPLSLDITGNITTYLIAGHSDDIYNAAVEDADNEILWCIEDNEDDPKYLYIFQIFKSKFTDHDASVGGADTLNVSFPFQSFGEQAIRILRVTLPEVSATADTEKVVVTATLDADPALIGVVAKKDGVEIEGLVSTVDNVVTLTFDSAVDAGSDIDVIVSYTTIGGDADSKGVILETTLTV